jgi:hypothetical protein
MQEATRIVLLLMLMAVRDGNLSERESTYFCDKAE